MTEDEVYQALGLEQPDEYAIKQMRRNLSEEVVANIGAKSAINSVNRKTGVTTRIMVSAVRRSLESPPRKVLLRHQNEGLAYKCRQIAKGWSERVGGEPTAILMSHSYAWNCDYEELWL